MFFDFGDVARAYFHAQARRRVCVDLSVEDFEGGECGLLKKAMYGTHDAARNWEMEYTEMLVAPASGRVRTVRVCSATSRRTSE